MNLLLSKDIESWSVEEVCLWLTELKLPGASALERVQEKIRSQDVNGYVLLKYTLESLIQDGHSRGCAIMLAEAIEKLKATPNSGANNKQAVMSQSLLSSPSASQPTLSSPIHSQVEKMDVQSSQTQLQQQSPTKEIKQV
jgi:hypothetical protein